MSKAKLISPMLDNFLMGDPISDHHGVRCCPAMEKDADHKYIVKIVSVPASQVQLDALLLTGACKDQESALAYFREIAEGVTEEAHILQRLAQLEGFLPYHSWQIVPMENEVGYDVYLLSTYQKTLENLISRNSLTQLNAINLGLDLCASLSAARRMGYLYADLKPSNVYITGDNEYRIGDLGFLKLDSLKYASLPDKYRSAYTAPEIADAYAALNTTLDIYAAGMILYRIYNGGELPVLDSDSLPAPLYADQEMAEIILKACAKDPEERWQTPADMGQAIVSYMQRNGANDTPIIPEPVEEPEPEPVTVDEVPAETPAAQITEDAPAAEGSADVPQPEVAAADEPQEEKVIYTEDALGNLSFMAEIATEETALEEELSDIEYEEVTEDTSEILTIADELISHQTPDPVIPPEPIDVPIPPPLPIHEEPEEVLEENASAEAETSENEDTEAEESKEADESDEPDEFHEECDDSEEFEDEDGYEEPVKKRSNRLVVYVIGVLLILALLFVGFYYYQHYYLQPVSITLDGSEDSLIVYVDSEIEDSKLTVVCIDAHGNQLLASVVDGKAVFENLAPNSAYNVKVVIQGFHQLTGNSSTGYSTPMQTNILQFSAKIGAADGSVVLNFTPDGPDASQWTVTYSADGEEALSVPVFGHTVTITGLTLGKEYTFTLTPDDDLYFTGNNSIKFTANKVIYAQELMATNFAGGQLSVSWKAPADAAVENWSVRCYNDNGYDKTITVSETNAVFSDIDHYSSYTIEVTAAGMDAGQRTYIAAGTISVSNIQADSSADGKLVLSWNSSLPVPSCGWVIKYTADGTVSKQINATENTAVIEGIVPGAQYDISIQVADGTHVFNGTLQHTAEEAETFSKYDAVAEKISFYMCRTPDVENWNHSDVSGSDYVTTFTPGEKASFVAQMRQTYNTSDDMITTLFVIRDAEGKLVSADYSQRVWTDMWYRNYGEFDVPATPTTPGTYSISIYFNGDFVFTVDFTVA